MIGDFSGMILAAGEGTRLRPLTRIKAKPAIPFLNRPLIRYSVELLRKAGIKNIVINLHHLPDTVRAAVADFPLNIHFSEEPVIQGTAGALSWARSLLRNRPLILLNGKIYFEQDLSELVDFHRSSGALVTLALVPYSPESPFNPVLVGRDQSVEGFARTREKYSKDLTPWVFAGVHVIEPEIFDFIPAGPADIVSDVYLKLIEKKLPIKAFLSEAYWCECSTPERYLRNSLALLERRSQCFAGPEELAPICSHSVIGEGVDMPHSTRVINSVIWKGAKLGANSSFDRVIVTDGTNRLPSNWKVENAIVSPFLFGDERISDKTDGANYSIWPLTSD